MQAYSLRAGVHYCTIDAVTTFLDVDADRYFGLPPACQKAFAQLVASGFASGTDAIELQPLIRANLLVPVKEPGHFPSPATAPTVRQSALDLLGRGGSAWQFVAAWRCQAQAGRELSRRTLSQTLDRLRARKRIAEPIVERPPDALLCTFLSTSAVTSTRDQCLRRSVAMIDFLARHNCYPLFVIGVKTLPFAAHAWVQLDDMILNDEVEQVGRFTPILVI